MEESGAGVEMALTRVGTKTGVNRVSEMGANRELEIGIKRVLETKNKRLSQTGVKRVPETAIQRVQETGLKRVSEKLTTAMGIERVSGMEVKGYPKHEKYLF